MSYSSRREPGVDTAAPRPGKFWLALVAAIALVLGPTPLAALATDTVDAQAQPAAVAAPTPDEAVAAPPAADPPPAPEPEPAPAPAPEVAPAPAPEVAPAAPAMEAPAPAVEAPATEGEAAPADADPVAPTEEAAAPSAAVAAPQPASRAGNAPAALTASPRDHDRDDDDADDEVIGFCHATKSGKLEFTKDEADDVLDDHAYKHSNDIIPPFRYKNYAGQNWTAANQQILANGCKKPVVVDPVYTAPTVTLDVAQCETDKGAVAKQMSATLTGLTVGQKYVLTLTRDGKVQSKTQTITATATTQTVSVSISGAATYSVTVLRVGAKEAERSAPATLVVEPCPKPEDMVTYCHGPDFKHPWEKLRTSKTGALNGHALKTHPSDIIPPFWHGKNNAEYFKGQNWTAAGQDIWNNGCKAVSYPAPTVSIAVDQCVAAGGVVPEKVAIALSGLTIGQQYSVRFGLDGQIPQTLTPITATATSYTIQSPISGPGSYTASVARIGLNGTDKAVEFTTTVVPCPRVEEPEYEVPVVTLDVDQCEVPGGALPPVITANLSNLHEGETYVVTVTEAGKDPVTLDGVVAGSETATVSVPVSGAGEVTVTVIRDGASEEDRSEAVSATIAPCPEPEYPVPSIVLNVDQCMFVGGSVPETVTATLGGLVGGSTYLVTLHEGGTVRELPTAITAETDSYSLQIPISGAGAVQASVIRVGADETDRSELSLELNVTACPDADFDLALAKAAAVDGDVAEVGDMIRYTLTLTGSGEHAALNPVITDTLPAGLTFAGGETAPAGWVIAGTDTITASFTGAFTGEAVIEFDAMVVSAPESGEIVNRACVASDGVAQNDAVAVRLAGEPDGDADGGSDGEPDGDETPAGTGDTDSANDCGEATTAVRSVAVSGSAVCVNDTPWFSYAVTPTGVSDTAALPISIIWWTEEAYAARDQSIPAGDHAAILANGASQVDTLAYPDGWKSGQEMSGQMLWPGASVDASGKPTGWPGWTQRADGTWVEDPAAPFYELRGKAIVEIRINPTGAATAVYPPATPNCDARPPVTTPPAVVPTDKPQQPGTAPKPSTMVPAKLTQPLAETGASNSALTWIIGAGLLTTGVLLAGLRIRRRETAVVGSHE